MIAQDLWHAHYQMLSTIFLKEFRELKVNLDTIKKCETCGIKYKHSDYFLKYANFIDDLIEQKCLICNKNFQIKFCEKLKGQFFNTYRFSNHVNNKFNLLS